MNVLFEDLFNAEKIGVGSTLNPTVKNVMPTEEKGYGKNVLLGIDFQNDFMERGSLGVNGSHLDVKNFAHFIHRQAQHIDKIIMSLDTHNSKQIFHPCWWSNQKGEHPEPFTVITLQDVKSKKWMALYHQEESFEYITSLEKEGKKSLVIWPYHCLKGSFGASIESQLYNVLYAYTLHKKIDVSYIEKGLMPTSEMYGIIKPEYSHGADLTNHKLMRELTQYRNIIIGGEAKSHCVLDSIIQIIEGFEDMNHINYTIYILQDCMSSITGFEKETEEKYKHLAEKYPVILTSSKELELKKLIR